MKIKQRIVLRYDSPFWDEIDRLALSYKKGDPRIALSVLEITEDRPEWPEVERLLAKHGEKSISYSNVYSKAELDTAEWLVLGARGHHGYPQPEDGFGYRQATYDLSQSCPTCNIGGVQKAPFRLRSEPKASRSQFLQLNWVFDEFFLRDEARLGLEAAGITGFDLLRPVLHKSGRPSEQVTQMVVKTILPPALQTQGLQPVTCKPRNEEWNPRNRLRRPEPDERPHCQRVKYHFIRRGPFRLRRGAFAAAPDVVKSHEWFGSGGRAEQLVLVSQKFRRTVIEAKWRGLYFEPIELVD